MADTLTFTAAQRDILAAVVRELKCPTCKAYALYLHTEGTKTVVRCRKCAFAEPLEVFVRTRLGYAVTEGRASVRYADLFGDERVVWLD